MERLISLLGYGVMILLALALSSNRKQFPKRIVIVGTVLQVIIAAFMFRTTIGQTIFGAMGAFFDTMLSAVDTGSRFVFGDVFKEHFFAFKILPTIIFVSALMSILYYLRVMQAIVAVLAWIMVRTMQLSGAEALSAAANVFVGQTEAPLVVRPYVSSMTRSELMALMICGFATTAGGVLAAYVGMGIDAAHLLTASVIATPAALLIGKIIEPEISKPVTMGEVKIDIPIEATNVIEATAEGTSEGLKLALNVGAMLIVFLGLIALIDICLGYTGEQLFGFKDADRWSLGAIFSYLFWPIAWVMGVEYRDCNNVAHLLGVKMAANEFVAYQILGEWLKPETPEQISPRTLVILTYALCGFSNFSSIGIQIGGIGAMAPERRSDLAQLGMRAMLGGTLACCMTACIAGLLIPADLTPSLEGTAWMQRDADGKATVYEFKADRELSILPDEPAAGPKAGLWKQTGKNLHLSLDNGATRVKAIIQGDGMTGQMESADAKSVWTASKN